MHDAECVSFLQWCLPQLGMRWSAFRKVRSQVCKRLEKRLRELQVRSLEAYRDYLQTHIDEWNHLAGLCRITISRFYRDRAVFNALHWKVLPELASLSREQKTFRLRCWSCGCASGEEVYTLKILWSFCAMDFPDLEIEMTATDIDDHLLKRARLGVYPGSSLRELPLEWRRRFFQEELGEFRIRDSLKDHILWLEQNVLTEIPKGTFDLILCRNLVFTYFDPILQQKVLQRLEAVARPGAALVIGQTESLPNTHAFHPWIHQLRIYRRMVLNSQEELQPEKRLSRLDRSRLDRV